jgi:hypothetical protein
MEEQCTAYIAYVADISFVDAIGRVANAETKRANMGPVGREFISWLLSVPVNMVSMLFLLWAFAILT